LLLLSRPGSRAETVFTAGRKLALAGAKTPNAEAVIPHYVSDEPTVSILNFDISEFADPG